MDIADLLLEKMLSWISQMEECPNQLEKMAEELESIRENCNASQCLGNSALVVGAACQLGATLFTGGAATPVLELIGNVSTGAGQVITKGTPITEYFLSSGPMKKANGIMKKSKEMEREIEDLTERLRDQIRKENPSFSQDQLDQVFLIQMVKAMAKRNGINVDLHFNQHNDLEEPIANTRLRYLVIGAAVGILAVFAPCCWERVMKRLSNRGSSKFQAFLLGTTVVGRAVGMAFALPEAIDCWTKMIKNNHVTEASQSMRDKAGDIRKRTRTLRTQLDTVRNKLEEMAKGQQEEGRSSATPAVNPDTGAASPDMAEEDKTVADLREDIRWLREKLREKEDQLIKTQAAAHKQSMPIVLDEDE